MEVKMSPSNPNFDSQGEEIFYNLIKDSNGLKGWIAIFDLRIQKHKEKRIGQSDFVLIGPPGLFVIEVKGGPHQEWDPEIPMYTWGDPSISTQMNESKESPIEQANGNAQSLINFFYENLDKKILHPGNINVGFAAAFPQANTKHWSDVEWNSTQIFDLSTKNISFFLKDLAEFSKKTNHRSLSVKDIDYIHKTLRQKKISIVKLNSETGEKDLINIEGELKENIEEIDWSINTRLLYRGGAGTGKTVMASYIAERYGLNPAKRVLWVSFNAPFTKNIRKTLEDYENIEVTTRDALFAKTLKSFGYEFKVDNEENSLLFTTCVVDAVNLKIFKQYDVIILDEAQDVITDNFFIALDSMLVGGLKDGNWFIFLDDEFQADIFKRLNKDRLEELQKYSNRSNKLLKNRRNPFKVIQKIEEYVGIKIDNKRNFSGQFDVKVNSLLQSKYGAYNKRVIEDTLVQLVKDKRQDIVVLMNKSDMEIKRIIDNSYLENKSKRVLNKKIQFYNKEIPKFVDSNCLQIPFMNLSRFKGLEAKTVIVVWDLNKYNNKEDIAEYYTAITRSTESVILILDSEIGA